MNLNSETYTRIMHKQEINTQNLMYQIIERIAISHGQNQYLVPPNVANINWNK